MNTVRRHERLWRGPRRQWRTVTAALDLVQDTAWALETYAQEADVMSVDTPHAYLQIFGVLNGLVIQQDATFALFKALGVPAATVASSKSGNEWASSLPELKRPRYIRVAGAGHPIDWSEYKVKGSSASTFIVRRTVSSRGCQLMILHEDGRTQWEHVDLRRLIEEQQRALGTHLGMAIAELNDEDERHRMEYASKPLTKLFTTGTWNSKVVLAVHGSEPAELGLGGLATVEESLSSFKAALAERQRPFDEPLLGLYRRGGYAIQKLREYFKNGRTGLDAEMAEILAEHLDTTVQEVMDIASEIDNDYASPRII